MEDKEDIGQPKELTEEQLSAMMSARERIGRRLPREITVDRHTYKVRQVTKGVRARIHSLELEAYNLSGQQKNETNLRRAKKIQRKLDRLHAKTAAYYLLSSKAVWVPGLFWLTWRRLMNRPEQHCALINNAAVNDEEINFSTANWDVTKFQLALSMRPIGEGVKETLKRWESASQQVEEDATKKKEGDAKSAASSKKAQRTKR